MMSRGMTDVEICQALPCSRRQFHNYLKYHQRLGVDRHYLWARIYGSLNAHKARLFACYTEAMGPPDAPRKSRKITAAILALKEMREIDERILTLGQSLGVYDKVADQHVHSMRDPLMDAFHDAMEAEYVERKTDRAALEHHQQEADRVAALAVIDDDQAVDLAMNHDGNDAD